MAVPIEIDGKGYFVELPRLPDFRTFRDHLQRLHRKAAFEAIPRGLSAAELSTWSQAITSECDAIDPFRDFGKLVAEPEGLALLLHSLLRHANQGVTLDAMRSLVSRAGDEDEKALLGIRELRAAMDTLLAAKKNEAEQKRQATEEASQPQPASTSTAST
jgi:hypothetical protein